MSRTSKIISDYIPVDMIVKAALLNGGNSKTSIENIYPLIKKRCIHPLSASGLWEILQSNKCAICHNTVQRRGPRGNNSVRFAREGYGFNICWPCVRYAKLLLCNMFKCATANIMKILNDPFLIYKDQMKLQYYYARLDQNIESTTRIGILHWTRIVLAQKNTVCESWEEKLKHGNCLGLGSN